jgi:hypothetical protein
MKYKLLGLFLMMPVFSILLTGYELHNPSREDTIAGLIAGAVIWLAIMGIYLFINGDKQ